MKCYHELQCENLSTIQNETLDYLNTRYDLSDHSSLKTDLWLKLDSKDVIRSVPSMLKWLRTLKLLPREVSATIVNTMEGAALHIDELPIIAKINIPILNYTDVVNEWYSVPEDIVDDYKDTNHFGSTYYNFHYLDINKCTLLDSIVPTTPIVFNSQIPHRVLPLASATFPRVMLSVMFHNEPLDYLND